MCKYVTDSFSLKMLNNNDHLVSVKKIKKNDFMEEVKECTPSIGYQNIANFLKVPRHQIPITLQPGDTIYIITSKFGRNHAMDRKDNTFRFDKYEILC